MVVVYVPKVVLNIASDRVKAAYGFPCSRALAQLQQMESKASQYKQLPDPKVHVLDFIDL